MWLHIIKKAKSVVKKISWQLDKKKQYKYNLN